jgi:anti-sigma B factor antagonist
MRLSSGEPDADGRVVLAVAGEVDLSTAPELHRELDRLVDAGAGTVVADLTAVTFLDSTGLSALVAGRNRARAAGGDLRLVCGQLRLLAVLRAGGFGEVFSIHPTVGRALAATG